MRSATIKAGSKVQVMGGPNDGRWATVKRDLHVEVVEVSRFSVYTVRIAKQLYRADYTVVSE